MIKFAVVRVPTSGPPALIADPCTFTTEADAQARIRAIEAAQLKVHHTHFEIIRYEGSLAEAMAAQGINI